MRSYRGQVAIVGVGETPVGKVPGRSALWFNAEATRLALEDAGIDKSQVDGLVTAPSFVAPFARMSVAVSEYLGIRPTFSNTLNVSGATAAASVNVAAAAIHAGLADTVVVCCGAAFPPLFAWCTSSVIIFRHLILQSASRIEAG